ncbi:MAG: twin-arginine translocation signal domain-containing protein, partial [Muribaculaceae bacterium]|nr:twin-arginine translocation signal domain-containing protein [Muribaculaceae bacterium]
MKDKKDLSRREFLKKLSMVIGAGLVAPALFTEGSGV